MSFGVQMRLDAASLLREKPDVTMFAEGTVLFFGFDKFDKRDDEHTAAFDLACKEHNIKYTAFEFASTTFWLFGKLYTIALQTIYDFEKAIPVIEEFGGSTERFLLKSADVRLTTMDEIKKHYESQVMFEKSFREHKFSFVIV